MKKKDVVVTRPKRKKEKTIDSLVHYWAVNDDGWVGSSPNELMCVFHTHPAHHYVRTSTDVCARLLFFYQKEYLRDEAVEEEFLLLLVCLLALRPLKSEECEERANLAGGGPQVLEAARPASQPASAHFHRRRQKEEGTKKKNMAQGVSLFFFFCSFTSTML